MKLTKSLFLAFAGLGLFACSNEEVNQGAIEGVADVAVKIDIPGLTASRAAVDYTSDKVVTPNYVKLTLTAGSGTQTKEGTYAEIVGDDNLCVFEGVENPQSLSVEINTKTGSDINWTDVPHGTIQDLNNITVAGTRMTGSTTVFVAGTDKYTASVPMQHTMARIEVGGIKHNAHSGNTCIFKSGKLAGVMLNKVVVTEGEGAKTYSETEIDQMFGASGSFAPWEKLNPAIDFFPNAAGPNPAGDDKCYAFNIYPASGAANLPLLTLYFTNMAAADDAPVYVGTNGFAFVDKYKVLKTAVDGKDEIKKALCGDSPVAVGSNYYQVINFPAGYVYQIKDLEVPDDAIHTTPLGTGLNLEATISVTQWEIVEGAVDWDK